MTDHKSNSSTANGSGTTSNSTSNSNNSTTIRSTSTSNEASSMQPCDSLLLNRWRHRVRHEYEQLERALTKPTKEDDQRVSHVDPLVQAGISLKKWQLDALNGTCVGYFEVFVPFRAGSAALDIVPLTSLVVSTPFAPRMDHHLHHQLHHHDHHPEDQDGYPFRPPNVLVRHGAVCLPKELLVSVDAVHSESSKRRFYLQLPILNDWTASNTIAQVLLAFVHQVQQHDPCSVAAVTTTPGPVNPRKHGKPESPATLHGSSASSSAKRLRVRKRDIHGALYPCRELNQQNMEMEISLLLVQKQSLILLFCPTKTPLREMDSNDHLLVRDVLPLQQIARITPRKANSLTLFVKSPQEQQEQRDDKGAKARAKSLTCRTLYTKYTEEVLQEIRHQANRRHPGESNALSPLFPFITPEHTDKAKELSTKFFGKLGSYASSVSKFFLGDDDPDQQQHQQQHQHREQHQQVDRFASSFAKADTLKREFFLRPSKLKMAEINRLYQHIIESSGSSANHDSSAARALDELQHFIERPETQKILLETCAYEQSLQGIRVHG